LSFDEYLGSFDTARVEKVRGFVDWLAPDSGSLVPNSWGGGYTFNALKVEAAT